MKNKELKLSEEKKYILFSLMLMIMSSGLLTSMGEKQAIIGALLFMIIIMLIGLASARMLKYLMELNR